jgi:membrane-bound ClpP family serine protease
MKQREKNMANTGKKFHFLDLRIPLGGLLSFYGIILVIYGLLSNKEVYKKSLGININLIWGILILALGVFLIGFAFFKRRKAVNNKDKL